MKRKKNVLILVFIVIILLVFKFNLFSNLSAADRQERKEMVNQCLEAINEDGNQCSTTVCGEKIHSDYFAKEYVVGQYICTFDAIDLAFPDNWEGESCTGIIRCGKITSPLSWLELVL